MSVYEDFLKDPRRWNNWLVELDVFHPVTRSIETLRFALRAGPKTNAYPPQLAEPPAFESDTWSPGTLGEIPSRRGGTIVLLNDHGNLDHPDPPFRSLALADYHWAGRTCRVRHGGRWHGGEMDLADYHTVEYEIDDEPLVGLDRATLKISDRRASLEEPLQRRTYRATGFCLDLQPGSLVTFGSPEKLNLTGDLTIALWAFPSGQTNRDLVSWHHVASTYPFRFLIRNTGQLRFKASNTAAVDSTAVLLPDRWYHLAVTIAGSQVTLYIYDDQSATTIVETHQASASIRDPADGIFTLSGAASYDGLLDEIYIFSETKKSSFLQDLRHRTPTSAELAAPDLKLYSSLDDGFGLSVTDGSSEPVVGTIEGPAQWVSSLTGTLELRGQPLPDAFGSPRNAAPLLVDPATQTYAFHSGTAASVTVKEGMNEVPQTSLEDNSFRGFLRNAPPDGTCYVWTGPPFSAIKLSGEPKYPITVDIEGQVNEKGQPLRLAGEIWRWILEHRAGLPAAALDLASFDALDAGGARQGVFISGEATLRLVGESLLHSISAAQWVRSDNGQIRVERLEDFVGRAPDFTLDQTDLASLEPIAVEPPAWEIEILGRRNGSVLDRNQIAPVILGTPDESFALEAFRRTIRRDPNVKAEHLRARRHTVKSLLVDEDDEIAEADRLLALFSQRRRAYELLVNAPGRLIDPMDVGILTLRGYDLRGEPQMRLFGEKGWKFLVLKADREPLSNQVRLQVWG